MDAMLVILFLYFAVMFLIAFFSSKKGSKESYLLNNKETGLWFMTFSTVATIVGAGVTVAVITEIYHSGISYGLAIPISFVIGMLVFGFMAPRIKRMGEQYHAYSLVDFFAKRFDRKNMILVAILQISLLIIWTAVQAIAIASLASVLTGIDYQIALFLSAGVTIFYTAFGGLRADILTDFIQFWIIYAVFIIMAVAAYFKVGGINHLISQLPAPYLDPFAFGGVIWFIGIVFLSGFVYMGNTTHWQRIFSAKNEQTAQKSFFLSIPFMVFISLIILFLGLTAVVLLKEVNPETATFSLIRALLPGPLAGIGYAAILAVIMSSIDSLLIGGSTILYRNVFKKYDSSGKKELLHMKLLTAIFGIVGFLLAFLMPGIVIVSLLATYLALLFVPAIIAGMYSRKVSAEASFYSILFPSILLFLLYPMVKANTFIITSSFGILIILFYDRIFRTRSKQM